MAYAAWSVIAGEQPTAAKWNILGTNDASFNDGTGIGTSTITPEKLLAGTGATNWVWTAWTPTVSAATGTFTSASGAGRYMQIGKTVVFKVDLTVTTIGTGTGMQFTLPVTANYTLGVVGAAREDQISGASGMCKLLTSATIVSIARYDTGNITSGGSGAIVRANGLYEAA